MPAAVRHTRLLLIILPTPPAAPLQVEAHQVALQTQSEVRAALAKSLELNQTLLFDQKAGKEALAALQEKAKSLEQVLVEQKTDKEALRKEVSIGSAVDVPWLAACHHHYIAGSLAVVPPACALFLILTAHPHLVQCVLAVVHTGTY